MHSFEIPRWATSTATPARRRWSSRATKAPRLDDDTMFDRLGAVLNEGNRNTTEPGPVHFYVQHDRSESGRLRGKSRPSADRALQRHVHSWVDVHSWVGLPS